MTAKKITTAAPTVEDVACAPEDYTGPRRCPVCGCWCLRTQDGDAPWKHNGRPGTNCTRTTWTGLSPLSRDGKPFASEGNPTTDCPCHMAEGAYEAVGLVNPYKEPAGAGS